MSKKTSSKKSPVSKPKKDPGKKLRIAHRDKLPRWLKSKWKISDDQSILRARDTYDSVVIEKEI